MGVSNGSEKWTEKTLRRIDIWKAVVVLWCDAVESGKDSTVIRRNMLFFLQGEAADFPATLFQPSQTTRGHILDYSLVAIFRELLGSYPLSRNFIFLVLQAS